MRAIMTGKHPELVVVAINDPAADNTIHAKNLKYDSVARTLPNHIVATERGIAIDGYEINRYAVADPSQVPWGAHDVDIVIEATGLFTNRTDASKHKRDSVKRVIISGPADDADITICMGVNDDKYDAGSHFVVSNASCTTNCLAQMAHVLHKEFVIARGLMLTTHAYTSDQALHDVAKSTRSGKADFRRMRAAAENIVPNSTGAARAIGLVIPDLKGKLDGKARRVPVSDGSLTDLIAILDTNVSVEEVNETFRRYAEGNPYLVVTEDELVSGDIIGNPASCVFSVPDTTLMGTSMLMVSGWYDNEWGYSNRLLDLASYMAERGL